VARAAHIWNCLAVPNSGGRSADQSFFHAPFLNDDDAAAAVAVVRRNSVDGSIYAARLVRGVHRKYVLFSAPRREIQLDISHPLAFVQSLYLTWPLKSKKNERPLCIATDPISRGRNWTESPPSGTKPCVQLSRWKTIFSPFFFLYKIFTLRLVLHGIEFKL